MVALGCVSLIVAVASDLLTVVVLTIAIPLVFMHNPDVHEDPNVLATMSGLLYTGAVVAALGAAGALVLGTLTRRRAVHLSEASYAARIATIGIRFAAPAAVLYAFLLCLFIFLGVTSG